MEKRKPELTGTSIFTGIVLAVVFGAANAYLGLRVGMTISASIPAAVIAMGVIRYILKRNSTLEANMVQTIGSAGESVAAGAIFTLPALFIWAQELGTKPPSFLEITCIALCGGILGILFMVPLRRALIVKEHGVLPYPEGTACAEVITAGEKGGSRASTVFSGMGIAAVYKFIADGIKLFPSEIHYEIKAYRGAGIGIDVLPALAGVGYICGAKIASYMLSGGVITWFVLMPLISLFGGGQTIFPGADSIAAMDSFTLWGSYIRYIGAGAVAMAGIISLVKSMPLIVSTFHHAIKGMKTNIQGDEEAKKDLPMSLILIGVAIVSLFIWLIPAIPVNLLSTVIIVIFGFFFATVSARMVGLVGSSNNPVSGMTIATLLIAAIVLKATDIVGLNGMIIAIVIGSVICIIAAVAGDTSQDLKSGFLLGATPLKQQLGELIGVVIAAVAIGGVLYLLNRAWGYGSTELPAPQAMLMKMVVEGVMQGNLPWNLVFVGAGVAVVIEILGIPVLPVAVGMYLPIHLSTPIMAGGLLRRFLEHRQKHEKNEEKRERHKTAVERGVLYSSGMIAGEGLIGILLAVFAIIPLGSGTVAKFLDISGRFSIGRVGGLLFFAGLIFLVYRTAVRHEKA